MCDTRYTWVDSVPWLYLLKGVGKKTFFSCQPELAGSRAVFHPEMYVEGFCIQMVSPHLSRWKSVLPADGDICSNNLPECVVGSAVGNCLFTSLKNILPFPLLPLPCFPWLEFCLKLMFSVLDERKDFVSNIWMDSLFHGLLQDVPVLLPKKKPNLIQKMSPSFYFQQVEFIYQLVLN